MRPHNSLFPVFLFLLCFAVPFIASSQPTDIRGVVSDSATGERIPFASLQVVGTQKGASSNINGFFLIPSMMPGVYDVAVSSIGYVKNVTKIVVRGGTPTVVNIVLAPQPVELSEVIITDKVKRELTEINTSTHVLEEKDLKAVPVTIQQDVFRAIQILPGIVSTSDVNSHFYVRGGGGDQNLIMLDGMKIYNPFHTFGIFSVFDADIIKTTEVYTGSFPPGFGGRLSSVVNMTTKDGKSKSIGGRANANFVSGKLQLEGPLGEEFRWLATGRKSLVNSSLSKFMGKELPISFYDAFVKVTREENESHSKYGLQGFYSGDDLASGGPDEASYSWRNHAVGFHASGLIQDRVFVDAIAYENYFEGVRNASPSKAITATSTVVREPGVRANATMYTDSHTLYFFGFEFSFPSLQYDLINALGAPVSLKSTFVETWSWFRYQATLGDLQVDGGLHADVGSLFTRGAGLAALQPRINVSYHVFDGWRLKGSYGKFNQYMITVNNEDDIISIFDAWIKVPDGLELEQADHFVAGLEGNVLPELSTSFQGYYKYYGSLISYNQNKIDARDADYINSKGRSYGFETLLRLGIPHFDCYAAYTMSWTTIDANVFSYPPRYDRRHGVNLLAVIAPVKEFDVTFRWEFGSGFPTTETIGYYDRIRLPSVYVPSFVSLTGEPYVRLGRKNAARLPSYHRLDMSVNYRFSFSNDLLPLHGSIGVNITNVYNQKNIFYFDRKTGQRFDQLPFFPSVAVNIEF